MTTFPGSPRLLKGAIVGVDVFNPLASVILFQYNPETLMRSLTARTPERHWYEQVDRSEAMRLSGPPEETIQLEIEIDAADQLEQAEDTATTMGVHPTLASLEMLLYPKSLAMITNDALLRAGIKEVAAPEAPLTLFVWGRKRVLPVRLTGFSITEQAFDPGLNPIRASVSLSLTVLNYQDLGMESVGGALFMAHQVNKERMATLSGLGNVGLGNLASSASSALGNLASSASSPMTGRLGL
jgi:hypothetical protein